MNPKLEITKAVLESIGLVADDKRIRQTIPVWWANPRRKEKGGQRLTEQGFDCFQQADIKMYRVQFDQPIGVITNQLLIWLDNFIDCPWYATKKEIYVFNEKMAFQLVLFGGNIAHFVAVKAKNDKTT